jgi:hypothetical protein
MIKTPYFITCLVLLFAVSKPIDLSAQSDSLNHRKFNSVKVVSPFAMVVGVFNFAYERKIKQHHALQIQLNFFKAQVLSGFGVTPSYRFYFNKKQRVFDPFVEVFYRYLELELKDGKSESQSYYFIEGDWKGRGVGLCLGADVNFGEYVFMEFFGGLVKYETTFKLNGVEQDINEAGTIDGNLLWPYNGVGGRLGLSFGFRF